MTREEAISKIVEWIEEPFDNEGLSSLKRYTAEQILDAIEPYITSAEVEIKPEMIDAGVDVVRSFETWFDLETLVSRVFQAMAAERTGALK